MAYCILSLIRKFSLVFRPWILSDFSDWRYKQQDLYTAWIHLGKIFGLSAVIMMRDFQWLQRYWITLKSLIFKLESKLTRGRRLYFENKNLKPWPVQRPAFDKEPAELSGFGFGLCSPYQLFVHLKLIACLFEVICSCILAIKSFNYFPQNFIF